MSNSGGNFESLIPVPVTNASSIYYNIWNYGPEKKRSYKLLAGGSAELRDGSGTLLSAVFTTLVSAQVIYPFVESLSVSVDWCAAEAANRAAHTIGGGTVISPPSNAPYMINKPFVLKERVNFDDAGLGGVFDEALLQVPTFKLIAGSNCHIFEGDPEGAAGSGEGRHRQLSRINRILLDGNRETMTGKWNGFNFNGIQQLEFGPSVSITNVSGTGFRLNNALTVISATPIYTNKCGQHGYWLSRYSDCDIRVYGFGTIQGSVFISEGTEAEGSIKNKHYGHVGNANPPSGKLKESITEAQTTEIILLNEGQSGTHLAAWGGTFIIGTEQISYTGRIISGGEETPTGVTRGANSTAKSSHAKESAWHEYAQYQDGITILGNKNATSTFDIRSDQNWGKNFNIRGGYDNLIIGESAQAGYYNPEAQDAFVVNCKGSTIIGNASYAQASPYNERGAVQFGSEQAGNTVFVRDSQGGTSGGTVRPTPSYVNESGEAFTGGNGTVIPFVEETINISSTEEITVPSWAHHATIEQAVGGGGGGGGGGAAKTTVGVSKQVGGAGGASALPVTGKYSVAPSEKLKCTIGAGGAGGAGGAANEHPGIIGVNGGITKIESTAITIVAGGGLQGKPGLANSEAEVAGPSPIPSGGTVAGSGGPAQQNNGTHGYQGGLNQAPGGDGGFPASATEGGKGGLNENGAAKTGERAAGNSYAGTTAGEKGANGKAAGEGGAGGGGGAPGGAGGTGGTGSNGKIVITFRSY